MSSKEKQFGLINLSIVLMVISLLFPNESAPQCILMFFVILCWIFAYVLENRDGYKAMESLTPEQLEKVKHEVRKENGYCPF